jgi:thiol-disulfide isomerase/thioredoxin
LSICNLSRGPGQSYTVLLRLTGLFLLLGFGSARGWPAESKQIVWYSDFHKASASAVEGNRPMMLEFWASWCEPCRVMDERVFPDPAVAQGIARGFVPVKINADFTETLKNKYNVTTLPTIVFTDSFGTELFRHAGYISAAALSPLLVALPVDVTRINQFDRKLVRDKSDVEALHGLASELQQDALYRLSNEYWQRALKLEEVRRDGPERESILTAIALNDLKLEEGEEALNLFRRCLKEFPSSPNTPTLLLGVGRAYALQGEKDKAASAFHAVIDQYPQSEAAQTARQVLATPDHEGSSP